MTKMSPGPTAPLSSIGWTVQEADSREKLRFYATRPLSSKSDPGPNQSPRFASRDEVLAWIKSRAPTHAPTGTALPSYLTAPTDPSVVSTETPKAPVSPLVKGSFIAGALLAFYLWRKRK